MSYEPIPHFATADDFDAWSSSRAQMLHQMDLAKGLHNKMKKNNATQKVKTPRLIHEIATAAVTTKIQKLQTAIIKQIDVEAALAAVNEKAVIYNQARLGYLDTKSGNTKYTADAPDTSSTIIKVEKSASPHKEQTATNPQPVVTEPIFAPPTEHQLKVDTRQDEPIQQRDDSTRPQQDVTGGIHTSPPATPHTPERTKSVVHQPVALVSASKSDRTNTPTNKTTPRSAATTPTRSNPDRVRRHNNVINSAAKPHTESASSSRASTPQRGMSRVKTTPASTSKESTDAMFQYQGVPELEHLPTDEQIAVAQDEQMMIDDLEQPFRNASIHESPLNFNDADNSMQQSQYPSSSQRDVTAEVEESDRRFVEAFPRHRPLSRHVTMELVVNGFLAKMYHTKIWNWDTETITDTYNRITSYVQCVMIPNTQNYLVSKVAETHGTYDNVSVMPGSQQDPDSIAALVNGLLEHTTIQVGEDETGGGHGKYPARTPRVAFSQMRHPSVLIGSPDGSHDFRQDAQATLTLKGTRKQLTVHHAFEMLKYMNRSSLASEDEQRVSFLRMSGLGFNTYLLLDLDPDTNMVYVLVPSSHVMLFNLERLQSVAGQNVVKVAVNISGHGTAYVLQIRYDLFTEAGTKQEVIESLVPYMVPKDSTQSEQSSSCAMKCQLLVVTNKFVD